MGDNVVVEKLQVEVEAKTETAVKGIDALAASFDRIKGSLKGINFNPISKQLGTLNTALGSMSVANAATLEKFGSAIQTLNGVGSIKLSPTIATQIRGIGEAVRSLVGVDYAPINALVTGLAPLSNLGKNNLTSFITQLSKIPQMMAGIDALDMGKLTSQIQALSNAFAPLATQMQRISAGFAAFPARIQRLINSTNRLSGANKKASLSYVNLTAKLWLAVNAVKAVSRVISSWITRSNKYIEDMNLFTASMGQYADDAQRYAEKVGEIMGIDPGEWMRNQGLFMTLATGFGVVSDRAEIMSRNLTQLGYDISSFFNMSFADAMAKLQSGLAGELEPLRRIGYDLSVARLQEEAYRLGINKRVQAMTQAEKAELRYYAIMTQVTTAQGDMARTLEAPSNQLRILKAQVEQAARALGNIFIPALNAILPYAIALAKVIRLIANEIATLADCLCTEYVFVKEIYLLQLKGKEPLRKRRSLKITSSALTS